MQSHKLIIKVMYFILFTRFMEFKLLSQTFSFQLRLFHLIFYLKQLKHFQNQMIIFFLHRWFIKVMYL